MSIELWMAAVAAGGVVVAASVREARRQRRQALRDQWGQADNRSHQMAAIEASHLSRITETGHGASLDDRTWQDLDLDAVFTALDRTQSTVGQHALYHRLRSSPVADHLDAFEALVNHMATDAPGRERAQLALTRLQDPQGYNVWWLLRPDAIDSRPWYVFLPLLTATTVVSLASLLVWPVVVPVALGLLALSIATHFVLNTGLGSTASALRQVPPVIATGEALAFLRAEGAAPLIGTLQEDVATLRRLKTVGRWFSRDPLMMSASASIIATALTDLANSLYDWLNLVFLLDGIGVYFSSSDLRARRHALIRVLSAIGEIDAAISIASYRCGRSDWVTPRFRPAGEVATLSAVCHPLIANAVPNTVALSPWRGMLVTGSNMSGKSTFLRTVGVATVLAQTIHTCVAAEYSAPIFHVRSCIGRSDSLLSGRSYYLDEVETLIGFTVAARENEPRLFLLDELFRGTNSIERVAAGQAVLRELVGARAAHRTHVVVAATHDEELIDLLADQVEAQHFGADVGIDGLQFDHILKPGRARTRNAIALLHLYGASPALVQDAVECAALLDARDARPNAQ